MRIDDFLGKLEKVTESGKGRWKARCPAHADDGPSLSVLEGADGKIVLKCFAGCGFEDILSAMNLEAKDLMGNEKPVKKKRVYPKITAYYDYTDAAGKLLYQVVRKDDKSFSQRILNDKFDAERKESKSNSKWLYGRTRFGVGATIYRLPRVLAQAAAGKTVFVAEGEKDVETLERLGLVATCNSGGAGKWQDDFGAFFVGCNAVVIFADNDPRPDDVPEGKKYWQGQAHALQVQSALIAAGVDKVKAMVLPEIGGKVVKDISDWVAAGGDLSQLKLAVRAAPPLPPEIAKNETLNPPKNKVDADKDEPKYEINPDESLAAQIGAEIYAAMASDDGDMRKLTSNEIRKIQSEVMFEWLRSRGKFYFNPDHLNYDYNMYFDAIQKELHVIESNYFSSWLAQNSGMNRTDRGFAFCTSHLHDQAMCGVGASGVVPNKFFTRKGDTVYISNGDRHMVRVQAGAVEFIDNGTDGVVFAAGQTLQEWQLVDEQRGVNPFDACQIFKTMPVTDAHGKMLTLLWILGVLYCHEKKPPIVFSGDIGSGKTRFSVAVFELLGLNARVNAIGEKPSAQDDFWVSINFPGLICWDNVDTSIRWLPDALASAATDGSREVREMYSNAGIFFHRSNANIIITSANAQFAGDAGLADRLITVRLNRLISDTEDKLLSADVLYNRDASLSWLCRIMAQALADRKPVPKGLNRRHPDWAEFAVKCGRAMGQEQHVLAAIKSAEAGKSVFALENNWIGAMLTSVLRPGEEWQGTSTDLCEMISERGELNEKQKKDLSPHRIGRQLGLIWPHLEKVLSANKRSCYGKALYIFEKMKDVKDVEGVFQPSSGETLYTDSMKTPPQHPSHPSNTSLPPLSNEILNKKDREEEGEVECLDLDWLDDE
ncbi:MAG: hypothetical protein PHO37_03910 [Kiritimatiellae bacterium]|nr:hypothetical protein [Kiritimatiellia bacterium]